MTDDELLELAAKAEGTVQWEEDAGGWCVMEEGDGDIWPDSPWDPLTDDGDAFRLAIKLGMFVDSDPSTACTRVLHNNCNYNGASELHNDDPYAATRRAIVRAAAQIGKGMK